MGRPHAERASQPRRARTPVRAALAAVAAVIAVLVPLVQAESMRCCVAQETLPMALVCPAGSVVATVDVASYGTPNGFCGQYTPGTCHSGTAADALRDRCVGTQSCEFTVTDDIVGPDPCPGTSKQLAVQWTCNGRAPACAHAPPPPAHRGPRSYAALGP